MVYGIDSQKMEEHLMWRVLSPVLLEPLEPALKQVVLKGHIEWHASKMLGFASGADARAQRAAATAAAAASAAAAAELSNGLARSPPRPLRGPPRRPLPPLPPLRRSLSLTNRR